MRKHTRLFPSQTRNSKIKANDTRVFAPVTKKRTFRGKEIGGLAAKTLDFSAKTAAGCKSSWWADACHADEREKFITLAHQRDEAMVHDYAWNKHEHLNQTLL